jgi:Transposase DDE domain
MGTIIEAVATATATATATADDGPASSTAVELTGAAAGRCLDRAGRRADDVQLLINAGVYLDRNISEPAIAALIQEDIGANLEIRPGAGQGTLSFDVRNGACGLLSGVYLVDGLLASGTVECGMVVGGDADPEPGISEGFGFPATAGAILLGSDDSRPGLSAFKECGRSLETARRSELADACGYGYCRSHSRWFWGMRLHLACAPDGTPRAAILAAADQQQREVALRLLPLALRGGEALVCDKGYAGAEFERAVGERFGAQVLRPSRADEPDNGLHLSSLRQLIESVFWTLKDRLGLERHRARTLAGIRARVASKLLALAAGVWLNHLLGRPTRAFAALAV